MIRLSPRLQLLLDLATPGEPLWDLCCDHGLLGLRALETGHFPEVHFVDQVPHIIEKLRARVSANPRAFIHLSDAAQISEPLRGTVVAAGVGGEKILGILRGLIEKGLLPATALVLCPQKDEKDFAETLPQLLPGSEWIIESPASVRERSRERLVWRVRRTA